MKKILVTTDYSKNAQNALNYACELAKIIDAEIHLVHTFDIWIPINEVPVVNPPVKEIEEENNKQLQSIVNEHKSRYGVMMQYYCSAGALIPVLSEYIANHKIDLMVMGMRGGGEVSKHLLGSNTTSVIDEGLCPVLVVPENYTFKRPSLIALASDLRPVDESRYDTLKYLSKIFKAKLLIFNVLEKDKGPGILETAEGIKLDHVFEDVEHDYEFPEGFETMNGIERFVTIRKPDLLTMIPRRHSFLFKLFREGHTEKVVYETQIPLLIIHE